MGELKKQKAKEQKKKLKVTKEDKKILAKKRKDAINKAAEALKERELKKEMDRLKEEERKKVYDKPILDRNKSKMHALKRKETMQTQEIKAIEKRKSKSKSPKKSKNKKSPSAKNKKSMIKRENDEKSDKILDVEEVVNATEKQEIIGPDNEAEDWEIKKDATDVERPPTQPPQVAQISDENDGNMS